MPIKSTRNRKNTNNNNGSKKKSARRAPPPSAVGSRRGAQVHSKLGAYARMLADPCSAQLEPGFYGSEEGYLARFHKVVTPMTLAGSTAGVVLWIPDLHNVGYTSATTSRYNLMTVSSGGSGSVLNLSGVSTAECSPSDPAYSFVSGAVCGDARTLSACMKMSYLGQMSTTQGMVAHIDLPFSVLEEVLGSGALTIDNLFELSHMVQRTSLDPLEQKWTPTGTEPTFKTVGAGSDQDFAVDYNATAFTIGNTARIHNPRVIGFAWKGFAADTAKTVLQFDCYKNVEWRPQHGSGLSITVPKRTSGGSLAHTVVATLDKSFPHWKTSAMHLAKSALARGAEKFLGGSGHLLKQAAPLAALMM